MARYVLYGDYLSPYSITVAFTLFEKQLAWSYEQVKLLEFETRAPEHRLKHPWGKTPVLDIIGEDESHFRICESRAICRFLALSHDDDSNRLLPRHDDLVGSARFEEAASVEACYFTPLVWKVTGEILMKPLLGFGPPDQQVIDAGWTTIQETLQVLNNLLAYRAYLAGDSFSLVDIWTMPWFAQLIRVKGEAEAVGPYPNLQCWWEKVSERPAWKMAAELMHKACTVFEAP